MKSVKRGAKNISSGFDQAGAFQCGKCSQKFSSMELLSGHMDEHCKDVFQCNMCNDTFSTAEFLSAHLDLHTNVVKAFKCGICNVGFLENATLLSHLKEKHEVLPFLYKCNVCLVLFKEVSKLISHAAKKHPPVCKEYKCGLCDKKFTQANRLTLHVQKHIGEESHESRSSNCKTHVPTAGMKMHLKCQESEKKITRSVGRKSRRNMKEDEPVESFKESKIKIKFKKVDKEIDQNEEQENHTAVDNDDYVNTNDLGEEPPQKSLKKRKKSSSITKTDREEEKPAIKNNDELIATYKSLDPKSLKEVYDCDVCGERFDECLSFTQHRGDHFFDDKFCVNCQHCEQTFDSFEDLHDHVGEERCRGYVCPTCGKSFSLEPFLLTHQVKDHNMHQMKNGNKFTCNTCEKVFENRTAFLRHASSHSEIKCIQCKLCRHSFTTPETLFGHLRTTHSLIPLTRRKYKFRCKVCGIDFMKLEALQKHESLVHEIRLQEPPVTVETKPKKSTRPKEKQDSESHTKKTGHWRSAEDDKKRRTCHICNRVFRRFKDVRRHIGTHTKPYLCSHCGKAFPYRYSLDAHIKAFHSAENPFKCEICFKYFSCPRSLLVHQRIHTGERPHQCHICNKRFRQVANLSMHLKLHNAEKPIKCSLCDYRCRHRGYLKRHMSTHSKEKKHFCPLCNKGFTEKPNLNHHLKRHTKIKNHVCPVCGHRFAERYYLNNHMRIHTKEKPYVCPVCKRAFTMRPNMVSHIKKTHPSYNYQPIRPSHQTVAMIGADNNNSPSMPDISLPTISQTNAITSINIGDVTENTPGPNIQTLKSPPMVDEGRFSNQPINQPIKPAIPYPSQLLHTQLPANIHLYHSSEPPTTISKPELDNQLHHHSHPPRDSILLTQLLRDQQEQPILREPQMITDQMVVRNQMVPREPMMEPTIHHEDPERRHFVDLTPTRLPETGGYDLQRDISNQNFSVVLSSQDYMTYTYPNLTPDPFVQGYFPLTNQQSPHPQQKP